MRATPARSFLRAVLTALWVGGLLLYIGAAIWRGEATADLVERTGVLALAGGFGGIGLVLTVKRSGRPAGWDLLVFAALFASRLGIEELALRGVETEQLMSGAFAVVVINLTATLMEIPLIRLMAVFPHDRLSPGVGRRAYQVAVAIVLLTLVAVPFAPYETQEVVLPAAVPGYEQAVDGLGFIGLLPLFAMFFVLPAKLGLLMRRGDPVERAQVRWMAYILVVVVGLLALSVVVPGANIVAGLVAGVGIPTAIWIAITRHHLYDIDQVISRTLTYALVAGVLAVVFSAGAIGLPQLLPGESSKFAVAGATLGAAALFDPLRRRMRLFVERRYHRLPYVKADVVDGLRHRLGDSVEPDVVIGSFVDSVASALRPASVDVWISGSRNDAGTQLG